MRGLVMLLVMQSNLTAHLMSGLCQKKQSQRWRKRAWLLPFVATAPVICKALTFAALSGT